MSSPTSIPSFWIDSDEPVHRHVEHVMGTAFTFDVLLEDDAPSTHARSGRAIAEVCARLHWVDRVFTTYADESFVSRLAAGTVALAECPPEVADVVAACREWRDRTGGVFDAWAGPTGFDPSGYVKGWAAQAAADRLAVLGFSRVCLNAGGDVAVRGSPRGGDGWHVGLVDPFDSQQVCAVVRATDEGVATSGTSERGAHVWRADGTPARDLVAVTVIHPDLTTADVLATAALARGRDAAAWLDRQDVDFLVVEPTGDAYANPGFLARQPP